MGVEAAGRGRCLSVSPHVSIRCTTLSHARARLVKCRVYILSLDEVNFFAFEMVIHIDRQENNLVHPFSTTQA